ncbi:hypothetical protein V6N12_017863 [Hibiscus sabdariffa]|uniref:Uncharacterized protein n=1 Tax=Hibiscus sabdariffa TaxID=183260 RepID=A0ABR2AK14_9ROSI
MPLATIQFRSFNFGHGMGARTGDQGFAGFNIRMLIQLLDSTKSQMNGEMSFRGKKMRVNSHCFWSNMPLRTMDSHCFKILALARINPPHEIPAFSETTRDKMFNREE